MPSEKAPRLRVVRKTTRITTHSMTHEAFDLLSAHAHSMEESRSALLSKLIVEKLGGDHG